MLQALDADGNVGEARSLPKPAQRELHQHQTDVAQVRVDQRAPRGGIEFGKAQRDVGFGNTPPCRGDARDQGAQPSTQPQQRAVRQLRHQPDHAHTQPRRPVAR